jgi:hypothetical protein
VAEGFEGKQNSLAHQIVATPCSLDVRTIYIITRLVHHDQMKQPLGLVKSQCQIATLDHGPREWSCMHKEKGKIKREKEREREKKELTIMTIEHFARFYSGPVVVLS